jgi:hypothetical protein
VKQVLGWAEVGGIKGYRLSGFWQVQEVMVFVAMKERVRSRKTTEEERSLQIHTSFPTPWSESWKWGHSSSVPVQMPSISSMKRPRRARFFAWRGIIFVCSWYP